MSRQREGLPRPPTAATRLLVVDWDYFVPTILPPDRGWEFYDWQPKEAPFFIDGPLWTTRAALFRRSGLPLPTTSGLEHTFWQRFSFTADATLFFADSNVYAVHPRVFAAITEVWLFDAHHDAGYQAQSLRAVVAGTCTCEDWMLAYALAGAQLHVRYPRWRTAAIEWEPIPVVEVDRHVDAMAPLRLAMDRVFVCRSGAWTPPWVDEEFLAFLERCPVQHRQQVGELSARHVREEEVAAFLGEFPK